MRSTTNHVSIHSTIKNFHMETINMIDEMPGREKVSDYEIIKAIKDQYGPVACSAELIDELPLTRQGLNKRLRRLADEGAICEKDVGSAKVCWLPGN